ncbi:hypothetical protein [Nostoc sp. DSM 114167]|uniref:hypothetical protein n=1 Tax=Nostoc sp. DSM 114167 TaxID=3439050 RepID=UPI0040457971
MYTPYLPLCQYLDGFSLLSLGNRVTDVWTAHITYIKMLDYNFGYQRKTDLVPDYHQSPPVKNSTPPKEVWEKNGFLTMHPGV